MNFERSDRELFVFFLGQIICHITSYSLAALDYQTVEIETRCIKFSSSSINNVLYLKRKTG